MSAKLSKTPVDRFQLRAVQTIFIFVNLVLIETHLPGMLWVAIGGVFWVTMVLLAAVGGSWMCGWICWVGSIQDFMEPFARSRLRFNARWGRGITLLVLVGWVPVVWWFMPEAKSADYTPFGLNLDAWTRHLFQAGLMLLVALSVMVLGKRGICRYLCPFNLVVRSVRQRLPHALYKKHQDKTNNRRAVSAPPTVGEALVGPPESPDSFYNTRAHSGGCTRCGVTCHVPTSTQAETQPVPASHGVDQAEV